MQFYSYGEDALTLRALTSDLPSLFEQLADDSAVESVLIFFRPSFGRRAGAKPGRRAAPFGEFDAIVGTPKAVYLIETKWSRSGETNKPILELRPEQLRRHRVFRWYLERWRAVNPPNWTAFATPQVISDFENTFPGLTLPGVKTVLADGLGYLLPMLSKCGQSIQDVLLFCDIDGKVCPPLVGLDGFKVVNSTVRGAHVSGYFSLNDSAKSLGAAV